MNLLARDISSSDVRNMREDSVLLPPLVIIIFFLINVTTENTASQVSDMLSPHLPDVICQKLGHPARVIIPIVINDDSFLSAVDIILLSIEHCQYF